MAGDLVAAQEAETGVTPARAGQQELTETGLPAADGRVTPADGVRPDSPGSAAPADDGESAAAAEPAEPANGRAAAAPGKSKSRTARVPGRAPRRDSPSRDAQAAGSGADSASGTTGVRQIGRAHV